MSTTTSCPDRDALQHFSLGCVRESEAECLEAHLACCPGCVETLHAIKDADTLLDAMRAQSGVAARPTVVEAVTQLMVVLKRWSPSSAHNRPAASTNETSAAQELVDFLAPPQQPDEMGRLGAYRILKVLGSGGMGVVFAAEDPQLRRLVALKALRPLLAASSTARKRFLREARAAAAVSHDHVVTIYQVGEDRGVPFLAMQYLDGETLEARVRREGPLPLADIVQIGRELAEGLSAAHAQGLLHRDIKPANIWLESLVRRPSSVANPSKTTAVATDHGPRTTGQRVKILDFGLAWVADNDGPLTDFGTVVGTPPFMAPEQARGEPADVRSDLFSLGSVLYAMCTGQPPFKADSTFATLEKVRTESAKPIREINPSIPAWLAEIVAKLHAKTPAQRFQTAAEVAALLQEPGQESGVRGQASGVGNQGSRVRSQGSGTRTPRRWWAAAAALLLLPIVGLTLCEATGMTHLRQIVAGLSEQPDVPKVAENRQNEEPPEPKNPPKPEVFPSVPAVEQGEPAPVKKGPTVYPAALFTFEERGAGVKDHGAKVTDILFAKLAARPELHFVDRSDLKKILGELELNISGVVKPAEANKIGQMTGAKIMISGSIFQVDQKTYLVARIVGTETSKLVGVSVDGKTTDELAPLVEKLAEQIAETIAKKGDTLVAKATPVVNRIAALKAKLPKGDRPTLWVKIAERHIGAVKIDPAAQTEVSKFAKETGFNLIDPEEGVKGKADILIVGEAISETATRNGSLVSVKARVEIKAIDRKTDKILAVDRQTALVVDLSETIAGKAAIQEAAAILAERILPKLMKE